MPASGAKSKIVSAGPMPRHRWRFMFAALQLSTPAESAGKSRKLGNIRAPTEHPSIRY